MSIALWLFSGRPPLVLPTIPSPPLHWSSVEVSQRLNGHLVLITEMVFGKDGNDETADANADEDMLNMMIKITLLTKGVRYGVSCFAPLALFWMTTHGATPKKNGVTPPPPKKNRKKEEGEEKRCSSGARAFQNLLESSVKLRLCICNLFHPTCN